MASHLASEKTYFAAGLAFESHMVNLQVNDTNETRFEKKTSATVLSNFL